VSPHQISLKLDDSWLRYSDKTIFKMAAVRHLEFSKFALLVNALCLSMILLICTKFLVNRTINRFYMAAVRHFEFAKIDFLSHYHS